MNNYFSTPTQQGNIYDELNRLKAQQTTFQMPNYRTTFTDIATEWNDCSAEEQAFINNDEDYMAANVEYQQGFNSFLIEMMGAQFLSSKYGNTAERVLAELRNARTKFSKKNDENIKSIQEQNEQLRNELEKLKQLLGDGNGNRQRNLV